MKRRVLVSVAALVLSAAPLYAGNGDLIVNGNLGVGTASPQAKLNIVGETKVGRTDVGGVPVLSLSSSMAATGSSKGATTHTIFGPYDSPSGDIGALYIGVGASADGTRNDLIMYNSSCSLGTCNMRQATIYADTTYVSGSLTWGSDGRLKTDVLEVKNSLEKLKRLNVVTYKWKDKGMGEEQQIGVIAQDVEAVFPELVKEVTNPLFLQYGDKQGVMPKIKSVDYGKLSAIAIQGVKELINRVDKLEERLQKLEDILKENNRLK